MAHGPILQLRMDADVSCRRELLVVNVRNWDEVLLFRECMF